MLPLAVSSGDPAGIGPEIALKAWSLRHSADVPAFVILADPDVLRERAKLLDFSVPLQIVSSDNPEFDFTNALPVIALESRQKACAGQPHVGNAAGVIEAIERGAKLTLEGHSKGLVTCPIAKKTLYDAGFKFPGHTEFLAALAERLTGKAVQPVMMLAGPELSTIPITVHIPLEDVSRVLTTDLIVETALITAADLQSRFGLAAPRIAVAGLNPHAGESGSMGEQEQNIIIPAIEILRKKGVDIIGPMPADTMFHERARKAYDVALCMYHDQALIPVKTIGFDDTVNVTLGLPFIRTSPDHGTAFDIADRGIASPDSFIAALKLANRLAENSQPQ
ncbi:4-hydroxythreonine-4-phosphate dehydrogenase PdxA [Bartonella sp. LJL80]